MASQFLRRLAVTAAVVTLGFGTAAAQSSTSGGTSSGGTSSGSKAGSAGSGNTAAGSGGAPTGSQGATGAKSGASDSGSAGKSGSDKSGKGGSLPGDDRKFVEKAARSGMAEVQMGQLAQQKGQSQAVKDFGARMVQDHGKANEELKGIASSKGVPLPADVDRKHKGDADKLARLSGDKFDREFAEHMVKDHKDAVKDFEKQAKNGKDADVRAFASKTLPTLQEHLKMAQAMQDQVKNAGKGGSGKPGGSAGGGTGK